MTIMRHTTAIIIALAALIATSCSNSNSNNAAAEGYTVSGTAEGTVDGDTVFLCKIEGFFDVVPLDTTVVANSKFTFKGTTEGASLRFVIPMHNGQAVAFSVFVLENADITLAVTANGRNDKVTGGPSQKLYEEFLDGETQLGQQMQMALDVLNDSTADESTRMMATLQADSVSRQQHTFRKEFIISHMPSPASDMLYGLYSNEFTDEEQQELLDLMGQKQPQYPVYKAAMAERSKRGRTSSAEADSTAAEGIQQRKQ